MWSKLFAKSPGFRGTTVLRDVDNPRRYLTIDIWDSEGQRTQALVEHKTEYSDLEVAFEKWTESKPELGTFSVRSQATVRPQGKAVKSKAR
jgi:heme-degrading monooxygenase HmoA